MKKQQVRAHLKAIKAHAKRPGGLEWAHFAEKRLWKRVLQHHAANGCELSKLALTSIEIDFDRYYA